MSPQLRLYVRRAFRVLAIIAWFYVATVQRHLNCGAAWTVGIAGTSIVGG